MPRRETRHDIERALTERPVRVRIGNGPLTAGSIDQARAKLERLRDNIGPERFARMREALQIAMRNLEREARRRRRPDEGGMPALVEPPRGPKPLAGGAAAPLEFD